MRYTVPMGAAPKALVASVGTAVTSSPTRKIGPDYEREAGLATVVGRITAS
jgi:hypothetical protein